MKQELEQYQEDLSTFFTEEQLSVLTDEDLEKICLELRKIYTLETSLAEALEFAAKF